MKSLLLAAALAGTALAGAATAQTTPPPPPPGAPAPGGMGRGMMRADTDGDGRVSRAEWTTQSDMRFDRMDANRDGKLCGDETMRRGRRGGGSPSAADDVMAPPPAGDAGAPPPPPAGKMARADANGDACVSRDEFRAREMKRFDRLDANRDGFIDATEMQAVRDRMMQMRERRQGTDTPPPPGATPPNPGQ